MKKLAILTALLIYNWGICQAEIAGTTTRGGNAVSFTTKQLMRAQHSFGRRMRKPKRPDRQSSQPERKQNRQNTTSPALATYPLPKKGLSDLSRKPQKITTSFTATNLAESGSIPPDSMGAVGPTQYIAFTNGRIKTFSKSTGSADNILNIDPDIFFASVANNVRTADPRIRYDRFSQRWFLTIINVQQSNNRVLIAVSSDSTITQSTAWGYFFIEAGDGVFYDYATLGIDVNALYIGGDTFSKTDTGKVFVVQKSSLLSGGPIIYTAFSNLIDKSNRTGIYVPQGVDNFDASATRGYFVGVDYGLFGTIVLHRVNNPGSGNPTLSERELITVPTTRFPVDVDHLGNKQGTEGKLDGIDDRLMNAHIRDNQLWTVHGVGISNTGVSPASASDVSRNGCRWYQINLNPNSPTLVQSGTVFNRSKNNGTSVRSFWMPSIMTNGQGHMAIGCSVAGPNHYANAATTGRLASTTQGKTLRKELLTSSTTAYNPSRDPGSRLRGRRWGDYSNTSVDPSDDMTMWTVQEFCDEKNSWGVRVVKLQSRPPATPISSLPSSVSRGSSSVQVTITGISKNGSGFFDPGEGFEKRISAQVGGGVKVNSVTYISKTKVRLDISTINARVGKHFVRIINPDGRRKKGKKVLEVR